MHARGQKVRSVSSRSLSRTFAETLERISGGSLEATIDGAPFEVVDADHRDVTVQVDPLLESDRSMHSFFAEERVRLWEARGVPSALARAGWAVRLRDGPDDLVRLGRGVSTLTGHVHVSLAALRKLRRVL